MHHAAGAGGVNFHSISFGEIDAGMQRKTAEKRIGAIAEAEVMLGSPESGMRRGTKDSSVLRRAAVATSRTTRMSAGSGAAAFKSSSAGM